MLATGDRAGDRAGDRPNTATAVEHGSDGASKFCDSGLMGTTRHHRCPAAISRTAPSPTPTVVARMALAARITLSGAASGDAAATTTDALPQPRELAAQWGGGAARTTHRSQIPSSSSEPAAARLDSCLLARIARLRWLTPRPRTRLLLSRARSNRPWRRHPAARPRLLQGHRTACSPSLPDPLCSSAAASSLASPPLVADAASEDEASLLSRSK